MKKNEAVLLAAVGGCAAIYAKCIKRVENVYWTDLGLPEAIWQFEVSNLGALIVAMDSHGNSIYEENAIKVRERISSLYESLKISADVHYVYWPERTPGKQGVCSL